MSQVGTVEVEDVALWQKRVYCQPRETPSVTSQQSQLGSALNVLLISLKGELCKLSCICCVLAMLNSLAGPEPERFQAREGPA